VVQCQFDIRPPRLDFGVDALERPQRERFVRFVFKISDAPAGILVPVGTFNDGRNVTLWAGVPPTEFQAFTVTRERADGDQASSGERVLIGTVTEYR